MHRGIQTFMKADYVSVDALKGYDVAFVGVPQEYGASYRKGTAEAPAAIRAYSYWDTLSGYRYFDLETERELVANTFTLADVGDVHVTPTNPKASEQAIADAVKTIRQQAFPLIVGGDHSIAYSTIRGCVAALPEEQRGNVGLLHIDAHLDTEVEYIDMPRIWHGSPFRHLIDEGIIKGQNHYALGIRGVIPAYLIDHVQEHQINLYTMPRIRKLGFNAVMRDVIAEMKERFSAVYVSLDIDSINPAEAPGTGTPKEGGFTTEEILRLVRNLKSLPIIGFELVEVAPPLDPSGLTTLVGKNILWHFLSFGLNEKGVGHVFGG